MRIQDAIARAVAGQNLDQDECRAVFEAIMSGETTSAQIAAFLVALRMKGETVDEISAAARVMREKAIRIIAQDTAYMVDTCGTGGDGADTFNISTATAIVAAGAGARVAKHGNRSVSSRSGSADVLEALGVNIAVSPELMQHCLNTIGICFMFAPTFHPAMKHAIGPRREMGIRTIFNVLGPITNPAGAPAQLLGVYDASLTEPLARVLGQLGCTHGYVVHSADGLDEVSLCDSTRISEYYSGAVTTYEVTPEMFGLTRTKRSALAGGDATENAQIIRDILAGKDHPGRDAVILNAAFALAAAGVASTPKEGIALARRAIVDGQAAAKLEALRQATQS